MPLTFDEVSKIVSIIDNSSCVELVVETGDIKLVVRRRSHARAASEVAADFLPPVGSSVDMPALSPATARKAEAASEPDRQQAERLASSGCVEVVAPMVGTFYKSPAPDKPPFVTEGSIVVVGDPLCLIEVMKLFTTVFASAAGRVERIFPENGELVEHGQVLFAIGPV